MAIRPLMFLPPAVFIGLAVLFYAGMQRENPDDLPSTFIGQPAPEITEEVLPGYPRVDNAALAEGKYRLVNFWASWCPPCRAEHPRLMALANEGVAIVGVNMKDDALNAAKFLVETGNPFAAISFDPKGRTQIDWGVTAPPETFIIAPDGTVAYRFIGPLVGTAFEKRFLPEFQKIVGGG